MPSPKGRDSHNHNNNSSSISNSILGVGIGSTKSKDNYDSFTKLNKNPILIQNPDGTIAEGIPPGYKEKSPRQSPRIGFGQDGLLWGELEPEALSKI